MNSNAFLNPEFEQSFVGILAEPCCTWLCGVAHVFSLARTEPICDQHKTQMGLVECLYKNTGKVTLSVLNCPVFIFRIRVLFLANFSTALTTTFVGPISAGPVRTSLPPP